MKMTMEWIIMIVFSSLNSRETERTHFFKDQPLGEHTLRKSIQRVCIENNIVGLSDRIGYACASHDSCSACFGIWSFKYGNHTPYWAFAERTFEVVQELDWKRKNTQQCTIFSSQTNTNGVSLIDYGVPKRALINDDM